MIRIRLLLLLTMLALLPQPLLARDGDTLLPITIDAPTLQTYPEGMVDENSTNAIAGRVQEARNAGVPVAVRIVAVGGDTQDLPTSIRRFASTDFTQPLPEEKKDAVLQAWVEAEPIESSPGADDGFLLLILVPDDATKAQALWWIGPNALPINGLTAENIAATQTIMNSYLVQGNIGMAAYQGMSEFSYNIQFGEPARLQLSDNQKALRAAVLPLAIGTALAALAVPALALWFSRQPDRGTQCETTLSPWHAAALADGRATAAIPTAMLLEAIHAGAIAPTADGGLLLNDATANEAVALLSPYASSGVVPKAAVLEIEGIVLPVRRRIEHDLAASGAMNANANVERLWLLLTMAFAIFLAILTVVPSVVSMARAGIFAIALAIVCVGFGWWWLAQRSYTMAHGRILLEAWQQKASPAEKQSYELVVHQSHLVDHTGGPDISLQTKLVRELRGLGAT